MTGPLLLYCPQLFKNTQFSIVVRTAATTKKKKKTLKVTILPWSLWYPRVVRYLMVRYPRSVGHRTMQYSTSVGYRTISPSRPNSKHIFTTIQNFVLSSHHEFSTLVYLHRFYLWIPKFRLLLYFSIIKSSFQSLQSGMWALSSL